MCVCVCLQLCVHVCVHCASVTNVATVVEHETSSPTQTWSGPGFSLLPWSGYFWIPLGGHHDSVQNGCQRLHG